MRGSNTWHVKEFIERNGDRLIRAGSHILIVDMTQQVGENGCRVFTHNLGISQSCRFNLGTSGVSLNKVPIG